MKQKTKAGRPSHVLVGTSFAASVLTLAAGAAWLNTAHPEGERLASIVQVDRTFVIVSDMRGTSAQLTESRGYSDAMVVFTIHLHTAPLLDETTKTLVGVFDEAADGLFLNTEEKPYYRLIVHERVPAEYAMQSRRQATFAAAGGCNKSQQFLTTTDGRKDRSHRACPARS